MIDRREEASLSAFLTGSFLRDPYPLYAKLRETSPVFRLQSGLLLVTRYADVDSVLRDRRFIHDMAKSTADRHGAHVLRNPILQWLTNVVLTIDPPDHTRVRRLAVGAFCARRTAAMRDRIQAIVDRLISTVAAERNNNPKEGLR